MLDKEHISNLILEKDSNHNNNISQNTNYNTNNNKTNNYNTSQNTIENNKSNNKNNKINRNTNTNNKVTTKIKIYTKIGDYGETNLCDGSRTSKDSYRVEAYGSIDELNSLLGLCIVKCNYHDIKEHLMDIQRDLFSIGSNLAFPADLNQASIKGPSISDKIPRINEDLILKLENLIDKYDLELPTLRHFILAGGNEISSLLHFARSVCRRAERRIVTLKNHEEVNKNIIKYVNRLSDYLFTAARLVSHREGKKDIKWIP